MIELITKETHAPAEELEAATILISRFEKLAIDLAKKDKNGLLKEIEKLQGKNEKLKGDDLKKARELTSELFDIEKIERETKSVTLTLIALNYLIKGTSKDEIREELKKESSWIFKHELLTRRNWMFAQKKAI